MASPFAPYANASLRWQVPTGGSTVDAATGNVIPETAEIVLTALLNQRGGNSRQLPDSRPQGVDETAVYLEGYAVEPMELPVSVVPLSRAIATWDNRHGSFVLLVTGRSPYGVDPITGTKLKGWFQAQSYAIDEAYTPPTPTPPTVSDRTQLYRYTFSWGDASPKLLVQVPAGRRVVTTQIVITETFNGTGAALTVGDTVDTDRLMPATGNFPDELGEYESNNTYLYATATNLYLSITPGLGASQGAGVVILEF